MTADPFPIWIGWDAREAVAFDVCRFSLLRHASIPLHVQALRRDELIARRLYARTFTVCDGQAIDDGDGRPFSTEFSFTRFLVPALANYSGWALFLDCDFLFRADVAELLPLLDDSKAVMVCRQHFQPADGVKMDGQSQAAYPRKAWSAFVMFNCGHPANKALTPAVVSEKPGGAWLHRFAWLSDDLVGDLPHQWNWIENVTSGEPKAVHFTEGGPWFPGYDAVAFAHEWLNERALSEVA